MPSSSPPEKPTAVERVLLTVTEAAEATGLSRRAVQTLIADRRSGFPSIKIGRARRVPVDALRAWIAQRLEASA